MNTRKKKENREATMFLKRCVLLVSYEEERTSGLGGVWAGAPVIWHVKMRRQKEKKKIKLREKEKYFLL